MVARSQNLCYTRIAELNNHPQSTTMTIKEIKDKFASFIAKDTADLNPREIKELEALKDAASAEGDRAIGDGDSALWIEMFNLTSEIDGMLGIDYSEESVCAI